jgi:hypothetical protein
MTAKKQLAARLRSRFAELPTTQDMSNWYDIFSLFGTVLNISVSEIFRSRLDSRILQAAAQDSPLPVHGASGLDPSSDFIAHKDYFEYRLPNNQTAFWFDYAADVGDGFHSTYYVAALLAQESLSVRTSESDAASVLPLPLPRGRFLILGGDEVYPSASREAYELRFVRPYEAASYLDRPPNKQKSPHLYAVPGNHDWYDGLASFLEVFTQSRSIGHWCTQQRASYFAIKLPFAHWIFAIDIGLGGELDERQVRYFQSLVAQPELIPNGTRIILCIAEPDWVKARPNVKNLRDGLFYFERKLSEMLVTQDGSQRDVRVVLRLAGDLHHYRRHESQELRHPSDAALKQNPDFQSSGDSYLVQNITAGGGGAFLHPTHEIDVDRSGEPDTGDVIQHPPGFAKPIHFVCKKDAAFPSFEESERLTRNNRQFAIRNPKMWLSLGIVYAVLFNVILFLHSIPRDLWIVILLGVVGYLLGQGTMQFAMSEASGEVGEAKRGRARSIYHSETRQEQAKAFGRRHGWAQFLLLLALSVGSIKLYVSLRDLLRPVMTEISALPSLPPVIAHVVHAVIETLRAEWESVLRFLIALLTAALGSFLTMLVFGLYLLLALNHSPLRLHANGAFASLRIRDYKNFLRIRLGAEGLSVYPIGIRKVPTQWQLKTPQLAKDDATENQSHSLFHPVLRDSRLRRLFLRKKKGQKLSVPHAWLTEVEPESAPFLIEPMISTDKQAMSEVDRNSATRREGKGKGSAPSR